MSNYESLWPEGGDPNEKGMTVSAQWLHDFAKAVEEKAAEHLRAENERLRLSLTDIVGKVESAHWGYDGDCGVLAAIYKIIETVDE